MAAQQEVRHVIHRLP